MGSNEFHEKLLQQNSKFEFDFFAYSGYIDEEDGLEYIFYKFNCEHPEDFKGHSLSVSDIVKLGDDYFYCQSLGWKNVSHDCEIPLF